MISVAILAGGQSRRMGQDKAFLKVGQQMTIERVIARVRHLTDDLIISTNSPDQYRQFGWRMVGDVYPGKAALGGIYSAIRAARHQHVLVVACDLPFLNARLLQYMAGMAHTADVIAPLINPPQPETTHTIYSKSCLPAIESRLQANRLRIIGFFGEVNVRYLDRAEIVRFDPELHSFINMNTPEDWERVKKLAQCS